MGTTSLKSASERHVPQRFYTKHQIFEVGSDARYHRLRAKLIENIRSPLMAILRIIYRGFGPLWQESFHLIIVGFSP